MSRPYFETFARVLSELESVPDRGVKFWFADVPAFDCSACGQCCDMDWTIHVNREYYEAWNDKFAPLLGLSAQDVFDQIPQGSYEQFAALRKQPGTHRCVLLDDQQRCRAHAALGAEAKPHVCQAYPHTTTKLPWLQYGTSFLSASCHKVARDAPKEWPLEHTFYALPPGTPLPRLSLAGRHALTLGGLQLWIGLQLDLLEVTDSFSAWTAAVTDNITRLLRRAESELGPTEISALPWPPELSPPVPLPPGERPQILRSLMTAMSARPVLSSWINSFEHWAQNGGPEPLNAEEEALLWRYQRYYWQRLALGQDWLLGGRLDLLHQQALWAITGLLIRLGALLYREQAGTALNAEHIGKATNVVQAYVMQNHKTPQLWKMDGLRPEACLVLLSRVSSWSEGV